MDPTISNSQLLPLQPESKSRQKFFNGETDKFYVRKPQVNGVD